MNPPIEEEVDLITRFVHTVLNDERLREQLRAAPGEVIARWEASPCVERAMAKMAPVLTGAISFRAVPSVSWWGK